MSYFKYHRGFRMTTKKFHKLFGMNPRKPENKIHKFYMDIAASIQQVTEEIVIKFQNQLEMKQDYQIYVYQGSSFELCRKWQINSRRYF